MFEIVINVIGENFKGIEALDTRRRFGFTDNTKLTVSNKGYASCKVSEIFARKYFASNQEQVWVSADIDLFQRGEMVILGETAPDCYTCKIADNIPADRCIEIFHMATGKK